LRGPFEWHRLSTKFYEDLPVSSKVIKGGHRETGDFISIHSFLESRLKWCMHFEDADVAYVIRDSGSNCLCSCEVALLSGHTDGDFFFLKSFPISWVDCYKEIKSYPNVLAVGGGQRQVREHLYGGDVQRGLSP
jgi:hypothetical protein